MTVKENELNGNDLRSENDKKKTEDKKGEITLWFLTGANILALLVIFFLVTILIAKQTSSNIV
jgi:type VI protein secretion system component VasF